MTPPTQLVVAGAGLIGKQHIERIQRLSETHLLAIVDPTDSAKKLATKLQCRYYVDIKDMFADCQPDGVILATPNRLHVDQANLCIDHLCPALIEKPIAVCSEDAKQLIERSNATGVPILVGHHRRHSSMVREAKAMISAGKIGEIKALNMQCWLYKPDDYFDAAPWRKQKGAGPISVNLVHDIDLARHLCGEIVSVHTMASPSFRGFENEDTAAAVIQFASGAVGTVSVSDSVVSPWSWELTSRENPAYPPVQQTAYQIGGTLGSLSVPDLTLWRNSGQPHWWEPLEAISGNQVFSDPLINQLKHLRQVILGNERPLVSGEEGLKSLRVIEALQQSALEQRTVHL